MTHEAVQVGGGKYIVTLYGNGTSSVTRHGEKWKAFENSGLDNLHIALARDLIDARQKLEVLKKETTK